MYCPRCGQVNSDRSERCERCSTRLDPTIFPAGSPAVPQVPNYLPTAILTTLCCCQIPGVVSIVMAAQSSGKRSSGDYLGAVAKARQAYIWAWVAFGVWILIALLRLVAAGAGG